MLSKENDKSYKKSLWILFAVVATELIGFGLIIPILPQIAQRFQSNGILLGILLATYSLAQLLASPILGSLSDRYGRKPILVLSKFGSVVSYIILAFSFTYPLLLFSRALDGLTGGNISVARAYVADVTSPKDRAKGMAVIGIAFGVGFILGPALGGILFHISNSHTLPALVSGGLSAVALLLTVLFLKEPETHQTFKPASLQFLAGLREFKSKPVMAICILQLVFMIAFASFETTFAVFTHGEFGFTEQNNSMIFFYMGMLALVVQGVITRRQMKNLVAAIFLGVSCMAMGLYTLGLSQHLFMMLGGLAMLSLGIGLVLSHSPALLSLSTDAQKTGQVMGIYEAINSFGRILGPLIAYAYFYHMLRTGYTVLALVLIVSGVAFSIVMRQPKKSKQYD